MPRPSLKKPNITTTEVTTDTITIKCERQSSDDGFDVELVVRLRGVVGSERRFNTSTVDYTFEDLDAYKEYAVEAFEAWQDEEGPVGDVVTKTRQLGRIVLDGFSLD